MREIKFRGVATIAAPGQWMKCPEDVSVAKFFEMVELSAIDPATVGQWTGLVDKDKEDIYENDVLESGNTRRWVVKYGPWLLALPKMASEMRYGWHLRGIESQDTIALFPSGNLKRIGNVHGVTL